MRMLYAITCPCGAWVSLSHNGVRPKSWMVLDPEAFAQDVVPREGSLEMTVDEVVDDLTEHVQGVLEDTDMLTEHVQRAVIAERAFTPTISCLCGRKYVWSAILGIVERWPRRSKPSGLRHLRRQ